MSKWKPISTAPKDGTTILIYEPKKSGQRRRDTETIATAYWHQPGNPTVPGYWCSTTAYDYRPTHWMPLPEPPK